MNQQIYDYISSNYRHRIIHENEYSALEYLVLKNTDMTLYSKKTILTNNHKFTRSVDYTVINDISIISYPDEKEIEQILKNSGIPKVEIKELIPDVCDIISEYVYEIEYDYTLKFDSNNVHVKKEDLIGLLIPSMLYVTSSDVVFEITNRHIKSPIKYQVDTTHIILNNIHKDRQSKIRLNRLNLIFDNGTIALDQI